MAGFDVQSVEIAAPFATAFRYIADPANLPEWTHAFKEATDEQAIMETPAGALRVKLRVDASESHGTIDWTITFPDGALAKAASRLVPHGDRSMYTFVLEAPPVALERLEGALAEQSRILTNELATLARLLGDNGRAHGR
jgi:hypothetical protein